MKIFKNRQSAGKLLAKRLKQYKGGKDSIVLGIPRGGVVVAAEVAKELNLPLDILIIRKIGHPGQKELAIGAIDPEGEIIGEVGEAREIIEKELEEIKRRENLYRQGSEPLDCENKVVILVDDGIATGATTLAAIAYLKRHQTKKIILAVPVASREAVNRVSREIGGMGEVIVLETPDYFQAVGQFYQHFDPVVDEKVIQYLNHER